MWAIHKGGMCNFSFHCGAAPLKPSAGLRSILYSDISDLRLGSAVTRCQLSSIISTPKSSSLNLCSNPHPYSQWTDFTGPQTLLYLLGSYFLGSMKALSWLVPFLTVYSCEPAQHFLQTLFSLLCFITSLGILGL